MRKITPAQLKAIHASLNRRGWMDDKPVFVHEITAGRTRSTRDLTFEEAKEFLEFLNLDNDSQVLRRSILSVARDMDMIYGNTPEDKSLNLAKMNHFFLTKGAVKKRLHEMNLTELKKTLRQMRAMQNTQRRSQDNKAAKDVVSELLTELNIPVK